MFPTLEEVYPFSVQEGAQGSPNRGAIKNTPLKREKVWLELQSVYNWPKRIF